MGRWLVHFGLAPLFNIQAYTAYFTKHKPRARILLVKLLIICLKQEPSVFSRESQEIEEKLNLSIESDHNSFIFHCFQ
jgi:hypothetical protein